MAESESIEQVGKMGRDRLYPPPTNPNWLVLRQRREIFRKWIALALKPNPTVLDVGGRIQPYRPLLPGDDIRYISLDLKFTPLVSVVGNAACLPFQEAVFDCVICTQMLEYVPEPQRVTSEIRRVLKAGGLLFLSVPSALPRTSEDERWRYLPMGIQQLLSEFSQVEIVPEGGSITGFFRTVNLYLQIFAKYDWLRKLVNFTLVPILNVTAVSLESLFSNRNDAFAVNYSVLARR